MKLFEELIADKYVVIYNKIIDSIFPTFEQANIEVIIYDCILNYLTPHIFLKEVTEVDSLDELMFDTTILIPTRIFRAASIEEAVSLAHEFIDEL